MVGEGLKVPSRTGERARRPVSCWAGISVVFLNFRDEVLSAEYHKIRASQRTTVLWLSSCYTKEMMGWKLSVVSIWWHVDQADASQDRMVLYKLKLCLLLPICPSRALRDTTLFCTMVAWLVSWCRGLTVSGVQALEDFCENALFAILTVFFDNVVDGNAGDFILTCPNALPFISIFNIRKQVFFL